MSEVQRSRRTLFEGISSGRNMLHVLPSTFADDGFEAFDFEFSQRFHVFFDELKKRGIPNQSDFDRFD